MATQVVLSVNGRDGIDIANDRNNHLALPGSAGRPGVNAPPAIQGEHAGLIQAELSRSTTREGGVAIRAVNQRGSQLIPPVTEILPRSKVIFTATGGRGEPGRVGGNGEVGSFGANGSNATREVDATEGHPGGIGGTGGLGSNGGNGGNGGFIQLIIDEDNLEVLYGVSFDISGGEGGDIGKHGTPGEGGKGGAGGTSIVWEEVVDHKYKCTTNCIGGSTEVALIGNQRDTTMELFQRLQQQTASQSSLNKAIALTVAMTSRQTKGATTTSRVCRCHGGEKTSVCPGCETTPIHRTFSRLNGRNGVDGATGAIPSEALISGLSGTPGRVSIVVRQKAGKGLEGHSSFRLKLVAFDIEDENADGIFEPGENISIHRIQVHNSGGVISPKSPIQCSLSALSTVISGSTPSTTFLQTSIPAGSTQASTGMIQAKLASAEVLPYMIPPYQRNDVVGLSAVIPWTALPVEDFDFTKSIVVQFPIEIANIVLPATVTTGRKSTITWTMLNKSTRPFGKSKDYHRIAYLVLQVNRDEAELQGEDGVWRRTSTRLVPLINPSLSIDMTQSIRISGQRHSEVTVTMQLFISTPKITTFTTNPDISTMQLIETHRSTMQVTPGYSYSEEDDVLIVTNSATRTQQIDSLLNFFQTSLSLQVNVWNVSIHGGLVFQEHTDSEDIDSILSLYEKSTVVLLANPFTLLRGDEISVASMCEPISLLAASRQGTSCLFFGSLNSDRGHDIYGSLFRPIAEDSNTLLQSLPPSAKHESVETLIQSILESRSRSDKCHAVSVRSSRFRSSDSNMSHAAKELAEVLQSTVPMYHFSICKMPTAMSKTTKTDGRLLVHIGFPRIAQFRITQAEILRNEGRAPEVVEAGGIKRRPTQFRRELTALTSFDQLTLAGSLTVTKRLQILDRRNEPIAEVLIELLELSIELQIDSELQNFVEMVDDIKLKGVLRDKFIAECLPALHQLTDHISTAESLSDAVKRVIAYCFASCRPQSKSSAVSDGLSPFNQTRKLILKMLTQCISSRSDFVMSESLGPKKRCVSAALADRVREATGQATYFQENSSYDVFDSLRSNDIFTVGEWDAAAHRTRVMEEEVIARFTQFQEERRKLEKDEEVVGK